MRGGRLRKNIRERLILSILLLAFLYGLFLWAGRAQVNDSSFDAVFTEASADVLPVYEEALPTPTTPSRAISVEDNPRWEGVRDIIGVNDIIFQPETDAANAERSFQTEKITESDTEKLYDFEYLRTQFYIVDADTGLLPSDIDVDRFLQADLTLDTTADGPKILVFHTHSNEMYADSNPDDPMDGVMGAGRALADILQTRYGVETLHHTGRYDIVDGKSQVPGAYERMEPDIIKILQDNPSIELVIDLHRDGLREGVAPMVTDINGERAARIMFLNGLCRLRTGGVLTPVNGLDNPYITDNMALSFQMQLAANRLFPDFTRKVYLKAYRYSLNMLPKSMLVEVGAQNNTKAEALRAMDALADIIAQVVIP